MKSLHPVSDQQPPERTKAFWGSVRFLIETIWALFGGPEAIAELRNLARDEHKLLASWLRKAEALVRRILVIEAAAISLAAKKYKARAARAKREAKIGYFYADEPQTWRVSFKLCEAATIKRSTGRGVAKLDARFPDAWPLAERFEALLRVFDAPELYVQRAARLLKRGAQKIEKLCSVPVFEGFEDIFEPMRLSLGDVLAIKAKDTS